MLWGDGGAWHPQAQGEAGHETSPQDWILEASPLPDARRKTFIESQDEIEEGRERRRNDFLWGQQGVLPAGSAVGG